MTATYVNHGAHGEPGDIFSKYHCCLAALAFPKVFSVCFVTSVVNVRHQFCDQKLTLKANCITRG